MGSGLGSMLQGLGDAFQMKFGGEGGPGTGYTSSDGLVNLPGLSKEDALNGFRSVIDFRHLYGPNTPVPNIRTAGGLFSGKLPNSAVESDTGPGNYRNSGFEDNPGQKMFNGNNGKPVNDKGSNSFLSRFGSSLSDQLFQRAMMGFMGGNGPY